MKEASLIPFVCGAGGSTPGAEQGSLYCFDHGLHNTLSEAGLNIKWHVNPYDRWSASQGEAAHTHLPERGDPRRKEIVMWHIQKLKKDVSDVINDCKRAVTIGGDHSMAAGSVAGVQHALGSEAVLGLVWVDAHTDLHTYESSTTKAFHGMPVGSLIGLDHSLAFPETLYPVIKPENIVYAGLRDIDEGEILHASNLSLPIPSIHDLRLLNQSEPARNAIESLKGRCDHIILSIDLDAFSEEHAPAVGTFVPNGFLKHEIMPALVDLVQTCSVPLIEVVEFNPTLPGADQTYQFLATILRDLLSEAR